MGPKGRSFFSADGESGSFVCRALKVTVLSISDPPKCAGISFVNSLFFFRDNFNRFFSRFERFDGSLVLSALSFCSSISVAIWDFSAFFSNLRFLIQQISTKSCKCNTILCGG